VHNPNGVSIGSAVFAQITAECRYSLQRAAPSLSLKITLTHTRIHGSLVPSETTNQTASRSIQPFFAQNTVQYPYILQWDAPSSVKVAPSHGGSGPHLIHGSLGLLESTTQTASRSVQPFVQGSLVWQTDRPTDRGRGHICIIWRIRLNRPSAAAMWPYVKLFWTLIIYLINEWH